jgi:hypothetical protein
MKSTLNVPAQLSNLSVVRSFIAEAGGKFCVDEDFIYGLVLAVDEAVTNIILHGYGQSPSRMTLPGLIPPAIRHQILPNLWNNANAAAWASTWCVI